MKVLYFFILSLFVICLSGCDAEKHESESVVVAATDKGSEKKVAVKIEKRPLVQTKRTGKIDDIPVVAKSPDDMRPQLEKKIRFDGMDQDSGL